MSTETIWFVGTPLLGAGAIAMSLVVPRWRRHAYVADHGDMRGALPLVARHTEAPTDMSASEAAPEAAPETAQDSMAERSVLRPPFGLRLARGLTAVLRRPPNARRSASADAAAPCPGAAADVAATAPTTNLIPFAVPAHEGSEEPLDPGAPLLHDEGADDTTVQQRVLENGIIDLPIPEGEDPERWRAGIREREELIVRRDEELQRSRDAADDEDARHADDLAANARQREAENIAATEEARLRAETRARRWFVRLDPELETPSVPERNALLASLGSVRAPWAGTLLRTALEQEDDADVRARAIGALISGDHLDVVEPFVDAFERGGLERAAVFEMLMPRQDEAPWIRELLAPFLVA